jgi:hypothetical protein
MANDPRISLVTRIKETWPFWKAGDEVMQAGIVELSGSKIGFPLPSHSALLLDLANKYFQETKDFLKFWHFEKVNKWMYRPKDNSQFYDFLTKRIVSVILPYDALESFINLEILLISHHHRERFWSYDPEDIKLWFRWKIFTLMPVLYWLWNKFPEEENKIIERNFVSLYDARNKFIHVDPEYILSRDGHDETMWQFICSRNFENYSRISKEIIDLLCKLKSSSPHWAEKLTI